MPIGTPLALGNTSAASGTTTLVLTTTATAPVGSTIIVAAGGGGAAMNPVSAVDSAGNTYTTFGAETKGGTGYTAVFYAPVTAQLASGGTITVTYGASTGDKQMIAVSITGLAGSPFDSEAANSSAVVDTHPSVTSAALAQANEIVFGLVGGGTIPTVTEDAAFTSLGTVSSSTWIHFAYKIVSATTAVTYAPTLSVGSKWGAQIDAFKGLSVAAASAFSRARALSYLTI